MDIAMPGIDGIRALSMLKSNPATSAIPVVMLSAHAMRSDKLAAFDAHCAAYMTKPINTRTFANELVEIIKTAKSSPEETPC
jgi:CheY-like chemotaxis protein